jgi:transposase InsO family protein
VVVVVVIERWRRYYNQKRPYSSLGNRLPAVTFGETQLLELEMVMQ